VIVVLDVLRVAYVTELLARVICLGKAQLMNLAFLNDDG
jgi:hypothetical protein